MTNSQPSPKTPPQLDRTIRWFLDVVTHADGPLLGVEMAAQESRGYQIERADQIIKAGPQLDEHASLEIYSNMYKWRLFDVLHNDFPALRRALGDELFETCMFAYIAHWPSTHEDLARYGAHMEDFLQDTSIDIPQRDFVIELARAEWAMEEVFDAKSEASLSLTELNDFPAADWGQAKFQLVEALKLLDSKYPVHEFLSDCYADRPVSIPPAEASWLLIYRQNFQVKRTALTTTQGHILSGFQSGLGLAECLNNLPEDAEIADLGSWFQDWAQRGIFRAGILT